jgi:hypothetical protein
MLYKKCVNALKDSDYAAVHSCRSKFISKPEFRAPYMKMVLISPSC